MSIHLSTRLRAISEQGSPEGLVLMHWCPGCQGRHKIEVEKPNAWGAVWQWDGNVEAPTITPSVNHVGRCHYFIRAGRIEFCADSKHPLAGQTVDMPAFADFAY